MRENAPNNKSRLSSGIDYLREMPVDAFRNTIEFLGGPLTAPVFMFSMGIGMVYTK